MSPKHKENAWILWGHHHDLLDSVESFLQTKFQYQKNKDYIRMDGDTSTAERGECIKCFQTNPSCRIAILSINACGSGITLTRANIVWYLEFVFDPQGLSSYLIPSMHPPLFYRTHYNDDIAHLQSEDRAMRIGQTQDVICTYYVARGTVDDAIWRLLERKLRQASLMMDGKVVPFNAVYVV